MADSVLTLNAGSSSIKFSMYDMSSGEELILKGSITNIGIPGGGIDIRGPEGEELMVREHDFPDYSRAHGALFGWLADEADLPEAIGHRVVHGGAAYTTPKPIDSELMGELSSLEKFAPNHLPYEISTIEAATEYYPDVPQVACFDTSFHRRMPRKAELYALPENLREEVRKYGFHGLSYEYIVTELERTSGRGSVRKLIIAHLGHGSSMAAVKDGISVDTTMGFTPAGGLVMSSRSGDLDPGVVLYLLEEEGLTAAAARELVTKKSGLVALAGTADMEEIVRRAGEDNSAKEALTVYCYSARKHLGALATALGGVETIVFTGGVGENSPEVRKRIADGLGFLGVELDPGKNKENSQVISRGRVKVMVMKTNEELMIARHTRKLASESA